MSDADEVSGGRIAGLPLPTLVSAAALAVSLAAGAVITRRPGPSPVELAPRIEAPPPAPPEPGPPDPLDGPRALARSGLTAAALATLGVDGETSFLRAERVVLLRGESPTGEAVRLALAAAAGLDRPAAVRALELLGAPACSASPAAQEARAGAALLLHEVALAREAAAAALAAAPGDPLALRAVARAAAAALGPKNLAANLARLDGQPEAALEGRLGAAWEEVARALSQARALEPEGPAAEEARVWAAWAWSQALVRRSRAGLAADTDRLAARAELSPLLTRVALARVRAARTQLVQARSEEEREAAAEELAAAGAALGPRPEPALAAALLAAGLGDEEARAWAEAWLGLAGDLPARALLALASAARTEDPRERERLLGRARRLAPDLPQVALGGLLLAPSREGEPGGHDPRALLALARSLVTAPELYPLARAQLEGSPLAPEALAAVLAGLAGEEPEALLARALARLHAEVPEPAQEAREAAREARSAAVVAPGSALAHLLHGLARRAAGDPPQAVGRALDCAAAAAPALAEPARLRLLLAEEPLEAEQVEPLLLRGWATRLRLLLGKGRQGPVSLPAQIERALDPALDLSQSPGRQALVDALEREGACPLLRLALRLASRPASSASREELLARTEAWLAEGQERLPWLGPERGAAEALALRHLTGRSGDAHEDPARLRLRARAASAALRALSAAGPAGGEPGPRLEQLRAAGVLPARPPAEAEPGCLPDLREVAWTWFQELRRPDLLGPAWPSCARPARRRWGARPSPPPSWPSPGAGLARCSRPSRWRRGRAGPTAGSWPRANARSCTWRWCGGRPSTASATRARPSATWPASCPSWSWTSRGPPGPRTWTCWAGSCRRGWSAGGAARPRRPGCRPCRPTCSCGAPGRSRTALPPASACSTPPRRRSLSSTPPSSWAKSRPSGPAGAGRAWPVRWATARPSPAAWRRRVRRCAPLARSPTRAGGSSCATRSAPTWSASPATPSCSRGSGPPNDEGHRSSDRWPPVDSVYVPCA